MSTISIRQLFARYPEGLRISQYQRHYVWGQWRPGHKDAVAYLTDCLIDSYRRGTDYFLQGITVRDDHLIDGQQRVTYLILLLGSLSGSSGLSSSSGSSGLSSLSGDKVPSLRFDNRPEAQKWLRAKQWTDITEDPDEPIQDVYYYKRTLRTIRQAIAKAGIDLMGLARHVLDHVTVMLIDIDPSAKETPIYKMMNGTKAPMEASDLIKADLIRMASHPSQPNHREWQAASLRSRYAQEWDDWVRWWLRDSIRKYYDPMGERGIDLLLKLCLRPSGADYTTPLTHDEYRTYVGLSHMPAHQAAQNLFSRLRNAQRHFEAAYDEVSTYNRLHAILLLHPRESLYQLLHALMVTNDIGHDELERCYKLSFIGMTLDEIASHTPIGERIDDLLSSLAMADVYHSDAKRDVFNLLLRLNIDEDTKLGRRFDFSIWGNRSLEHIYSKSKVWHTDTNGRVLDGNDTPINIPLSRIKQDPTYIPREQIVNRDGTQLSEHCIGNLVLLYGTNNATFGNATFDQKKMMFLSPGIQTVFQSRNLLHTVCVFATNTWDAASIVDNYNQTLKNLKVYYGY